MYKSSRAAGLCKTVSAGETPGPSIQMISLSSDEPEDRGMWLSRNGVFPELAEAGLQSCCVWESPESWVLIELVLLLWHVEATWWWKGEKSIWVASTDREALYRCTCLRFLSSYRLGSISGLAVFCLQCRCSRSDTNGMGVPLSAQSWVVSLAMHIHSGWELGLSVLSFLGRNLFEKKLLRIS